MRTFKMATLFIAVPMVLSAAPKTLRVAFNQPDTHPQYKAIQKFGEKLAQRTNNAYNVQIFPNELLGPQRETIELVQSGSIDMSVVGNSLMENFEPAYLVFNLPYVFDSVEHQTAVMTDDNITKKLYHSTADQGFITLASFHAGSRNVYTKKQPVNTPEDLKGQKIRIMQSDTSIKMMRAMGGVGTPMGQGEVYTALQQGVLDGGENNELIYSDLKHAEVAKYYSYTQHIMMPDVLIMNVNLYNSLPDEHKAIFDEEMKEAVKYEIELWNNDVARAKAAAEKAGAQFNYPDIKVFQTQVLPLHDELTKPPHIKELYDKVRAKANEVK